VPDPSQGIRQAATLRVPNRTARGGRVRRVGHKSREEGRERLSSGVRDLRDPREEVAPNPSVSDLLASLEELDHRRLVAHPVAEQAQEPPHEPPI
jgi:hypothetical protein